MTNTIVWFLLSVLPIVAIASTGAAPAEAPRANTKQATIAPTAADTSVTGEEDRSIYDVIQQEDDLTTLVTLLDTSGFEMLLSNTSESLTLFAPVNSALENVPSYMLTENWRIHLSGLLLFHVLQDTATSDDFVDLYSTETVWGEGIYFTRNTTASNNGGTDIYVNGFAFQDIQILTADILASNGVVHKVSRLFWPFFMTQTLLDVVNALESLTTLSELVVLAGAEEELLAMDRTLFAPSNEAFAAIPADALSTLLSDTEALRTVLLYHLSTDVYPAFLLEDGTALETVLGPELEINIVEGSLTVNSEAMILQNNLLAFNGIMHIIDTVLIPPLEPEAAPTTPPSDIPSDVPSDLPSDVPSDVPSDLPSDLPSDMPSDFPTTIGLDPEGAPTMQPSDLPSDIPTSMVLDAEEIDPESLQIVDLPSDIPSLILLDPEAIPTASPQPSDLPSDMPSDLPSDMPSDLPSDMPSDAPTLIPTTDTAQNDSELDENVRRDEQSEGFNSAGSSLLMLLLSSLCFLHGY